MKDHVTEAELHAAAGDAHRLEVSLLQTRIERLVALLHEHDIPLPSDDPLLGVSDGRHLEASRLVVTRAYDLLEATAAFESALAELRALVGSGMELVGGSSWRDGRR